MHAIVRGAEVLLVVHDGIPFVFEGMQYPADWIARADPAARAALGIVPVPRDPQPDSRLFALDGEEIAMESDGTLRLRARAVPRPLGEAKAALVAEINAVAASLLGQSDWMVVRSAEEGTPVSAEWTDYRRAVRAAAREAADAVIAASSVGDLEAILAVATAWPEAPGA